MNVPQPRWGWDDLALVAGAVLPTIFVAAAATRGVKVLWPALFSHRVAEVFFYQTLFYLGTLAALYFVVSVKHSAHFWEALSWSPHFPGAGWCVGIGIALMFATSTLGLLLKAPPIPNPWQELITGKVSQFTVILYAAILGPIWEELLFRGFLFSVFVRFLHPWFAILATAIPFGLIHGSQSQWVWQYVVMIGATGVAFGWVRYKTRSTAAAALTHGAYNTAQFVIFLLQNA